MNLFFEPDVAGVVSRGCAARFSVHLAAESRSQVVFMGIPQRNCYAEMPASALSRASARMVSSSDISSEVAHFGEVPCCPIPPSFCYLALRAVQCMPFRAPPEYLHLVCGLRYMLLV